MLCYYNRRKKILNYYLNMSNDILQLLNTDKDDAKKLFQNIIITGNEKNTNNKIHNLINKLLKYKSCLSFIFSLQS